MQLENKMETNWELIARYLSGECQEKELQEVQQWIDADPANRQLISEAKNICDKANAEPLPLVRSKEMWEKIRQQTSKQESLKIEPFRRKTNYFSWLRIAAVLLIAVGGAWVSFLLSDKFIEEKWITVNAFRDSIQQVNLNDGSKVWLNKGSKLSYPAQFEKNIREVRLEGEAFFEIFHNPSKHFKVYCSGTETEVLGTSFNIRQNGEAVTLVVTTGKVLFSKKASGKQKLLVSAGEKAEFDDRKIPPLLKSKFEDVNLLSWKTHKFVFEGLTLDSVSGILSRHYSNPITFKNESLKDCRIHAEFQDKSVDEMMKVIAITLNIKIYKTGNQYIISGEKCP